MRDQPCSTSQIKTKSRSVKINNIIVKKTTGGLLKHREWTVVTIFHPTNTSLHQVYLGDHEFKEISIWQYYNVYRNICVALQCLQKYTAISRKVVGKSARDNIERNCGWF